MEALENMLGKGQNAGNQHFLLFPKCFLSFQEQISFFYVTFILSSAKGFNLYQSKILSFSKEVESIKFCLLNSFPNKPWFLRVCSTNLLKTLWEKEKLLVTSNFSFSHNVFYLFGALSTILIKFEIVVCILFQFGRV